MSVHFPEIKFLFEKWRFNVYIICCYFTAEKVKRKLNSLLHQGAQEGEEHVEEHDHTCYFRLQVYLAIFDNVV